jgi:hypothetical protein
LPPDSIEFPLFGNVRIERIKNLDGLNNRVSLPDHEITFMEVGMIKNFNPSAPEFQKYNVLQQSAFFLRKHKTQAVYQRIINEIGFFGVVNLFLQRKIEFIDLKEQTRSFI